MDARPLHGMQFLGAPPSVASQVVKDRASTIQGLASGPGPETVPSSPAAGADRRQVSADR